MKDIKRVLFSIEKYKDAIIRIPKEKIKNIQTDENKRIEDFCIFILTYGRSNNVKTYETLMSKENNRSLNQDIYLVCSDDDSQLQDYIDKFGERVLIFNKRKMLPYTDTGDNFEKLNVVLFARNICFIFAKEMGYTYFLELDDDYDMFSQRIMYEKERLIQANMYDYDKMINVHLDFLKTTNCKTVTMSQTGDYIGGAGNGNAIRGWQRKVMNSFFCNVNNPFLFDGSINEDVNYYIQAGRRGELNYNLFGYCLKQGTTQSNSGGLTDFYLDGGTYFKSFYSVMYEPSCTKIGKISKGEGERIHHKVISKYCYPKILDEKYSKEIQQNNNDW